MREEYKANFERWFADSKVVDQMGEPLVVYHGTKASFGTFKQRNRGMEVGFHFGSLEAAERRLKDTVRRGIGARIMPVNLAIRNPLRLDCDPGNFTVYRLLWSSVPDDTRPGHASIRLVEGPLERAGAISAEQKQRILTLLNGPDDYYETRAREELLLALEANGFDGMVYPNSHESGGSDSYVAFRPCQIKSVFNTGAYDISNPDISDRKQRARNALAFLGSQERKAALHA